QAVTARCTALREGSESTDYFHIMLHYAFLEVVLQASPFVAGPNVRFQLQGTKGSYYKQGLDPQEQQLRDGLSLSAPAFGVEPPAHYGYKYWENRETGLMEEVKFPTQVGRYIEYYQQLALAISVGLPLPVTALSAAKVIRIIELAEQSSDSGQRVDVDLTAFH
ncbi:MAG: Gfo/Idh/MocA family oxidoreductase, partial [Pseudomonadales bacterium]